MPVRKVNGVIVYLYSNPVQSFEVLGSINMPEIVWNGNAKEMVNIGSRRCLKQYPYADGVLFVSDNLGTAQAIKLK